MPRVWTRDRKKFGGGADLPSLRRKFGLRALIATTFLSCPVDLTAWKDHRWTRLWRGALLLLLVPFIWSLPITLMVGELTAALPSEGGYYAWLRRALGPFWGVQTAWMALSMSLFDITIYPMLVVTYLGQLFPALTNTALGGMGWYAALSMIVLSVVWNLRGTERSVLQVN